MAAAPDGVYLYRLYVAIVGFRLMREWREVGRVVE